MMTTMQPPATGTTEPRASSPAQTAIEVRLNDYAIEPRANTVPPGRVTLKATNRDDVPHHVVLLRTTLSPDRLPRNGIRVDESDPEIEILARTARLDPLRLTLAFINLMQGLSSAASPAQRSRTVPNGPTAGQFSCRQASTPEPRLRSAPGGPFGAS